MTKKSRVEYKPIAWVSEIQLCVRSISMTCPSLLLGGSPAGSNLPDQDGQVLGAGLKCSESGAGGQQSHDWAANHGRGDGSQRMRSINRVEALRCLSHKSPKAARSRTSGPMEIFWGNPMPGTANCRGPGN